MVGQFHFARVSRQACGFGGSDIQKHLVRRCGKNMNGSLSDFYLGPLRMRLPRKIERPYGWKARRALGNNRLQTLYGFLIRCSSDIARSIIVVIREEAADFPVVLHSRFPILLKSFLGALLVHL